MSLSDAIDFSHGTSSLEQKQQQHQPISKPPSQPPAAPRTVSAGLLSGSGDVWQNGKTSSQAGPSVIKFQDSNDGKPPKAVASTSSKTPPATKRHEARLLWDATETEALIAGCKKHGVGNWKTVLNDPEFHYKFKPERSPTDLKDKFRTSMPEAYHQLYPNAKTHLSCKKSTNDLAQTGFEKGLPKETRRFTPQEDAALKEGYDVHGSSWTKIAADPVFAGRRKATDLRDRFRNAFPDLYEQAGYKPRHRPPPKNKERILSHGSSHTPHSHHDHAVPLPAPVDKSKDDLDALLADPQPTGNKTSSSVSLKAKRPAETCKGSPPPPAPPALASPSVNSGSILTNNDWIGCPSAQAPSASTRTETVPPNPTPDSLSRSLSVGSGMPLGQGGTSVNTRPLFTTQNSMPAESAQSVSSVPPTPLSPWPQEQSRGDAGASSTATPQQSERERRNRLAQWHLQQAQLLQSANDEAEQQGEGSEQPPLRRSQSYRRPTTSVGDFFSAMTSAPQPNVFDWTSSNSNRSDVSVAEESYASGQSQSLPPSQMPPANFCPTEADHSPFDDKQMKQINDILRSHAEEGDRQMREKTPQPGQQNSRATMIEGNNQDDGGAMDIDVGEILEPSIQDRPMAWRRSEDQLNSGLDFGYASGSRPRMVDSFQDLLDPLGQAASPGLSHTWNLPSGQGFVPVSSGLYTSSTANGPDQSESDGKPDHRHNPIAGDLLPRGDTFSWQFDFVNLPSMQLSPGYADGTTQGGPEYAGETSIKMEPSTASSEHSVSSTTSVVDLLPQDGAISAQRPSNTLARAYLDLAVTANASSSSSPHFRGSFRYPADDLSLTQTLTPAWGLTLSKRRRSTDTLREEAGDGTDASPTLAFLHPQDFRGLEEGSGSSPAPVIGRRSVSETDAGGWRRPISRHGLSGLSNLEALSEHSISPSASSLLPEVSTSSIAASSAHSSSDLDHLITYAESLPDLSSAAGTFPTAFDDFHMPPTAGQHPNQQPYSFDDLDISSFLRAGGSTASLNAGAGGSGGLSPRSWAAQLDLPSVWAQQARSASNVRRGGDERIGRGGRLEMEQREQRRALSLSTGDLEMGIETGRPGSTGPSKAYSDYEGESR